MLTIDKLDVRYGAAYALRGVSFEVQEGQCVCIIGANGAGKTTLLKAISGIVPTTGGEINFEGKRLNHMNPAEIIRLKIAHCPEGRRVFPAMTVRENLEMGGLTNRKAMSERLEHCFSRFSRLKERASQLAGTLSGGEQQMLAIGRALMCSPRLLMFDEPSLGLAPNIVEQVGDIIEDLHKDGITILLVEQNAYLAMSLSDYTYVLENGKIDKHGKSADLLNDDGIRSAYLGL